MITYKSEPKVTLNNFPYFSAKRISTPSASINIKKGERVFYCYVRFTNIITKNINKSERKKEISYHWTKIPMHFR